MGSSPFTRTNMPPNQLIKRRFSFSIGVLSTPKWSKNPVPVEYCVTVSTQKDYLMYQLRFWRHSVHHWGFSCTNHVSGDTRYTIEASHVPNLSFRLKTEGWSREPYGSEWQPGTDITLITSVVAADSLNLAETYSPVGSHPDKSDNIHLNGDYHKMLACSHSAYLLLGNWENNRPCCSTPSVWDNKKSKHPF